MPYYVVYKVRDVLLYVAIGTNSFFLEGEGLMDCR